MIAVEAMIGSISTSKHVFESSRQPVHKLRNEGDGSSSTVADVELMKWFSLL